MLPATNRARNRICAREQMRCCGSPARPAHTSSCGPSHCLVDTAQHAAEEGQIGGGWMDGWMDAGSSKAGDMDSGVATRRSEQQRPSQQWPAARSGSVPPCRWASRWGLAGVSLGSRWGASLGLAALWPLPHAREHTHARPHINTAWGRASNQQLANIRCLPVLQGKHAPLVFAPVNPSALPAPLGGRLQRHFTILRFHKSTTARQRDRTPPPAAPSSDGTMSPRDT